jgi:hypothetical protein
VIWLRWEVFGGVYAERARGCFESDEGCGGESCDAILWDLADFTSAATEDIRRWPVITLFGGITRSTSKNLEAVKFSLDKVAWGNTIAMYSSCVRFSIVGTSAIADLYFSLFATRSFVKLLPFGRFVAEVLGEEMFESCCVGRMELVKSKVSKSSQYRISGVGYLQLSLWFYCHIVISMHIRTRYKVCDTVR